MAHFAQLSEYELSPGVRDVIHVSPVDNAAIVDPSTGEESEGRGIAHQRRIHGAGTIWKQCSYNANGDPAKGYNYPGAGGGWTHDANRGAFVPPKPKEFDSWVLDEATCRWKAPIDPPAGVPTHALEWREETLSWKDIRMLVKPRDFLRRIQPTEWKDIEEATDPVVMYFRTMALAEDEPIDTEHPDTIDALTHMESAGKNGGGPIFGAGRKDQILAIPE